jgi:DNA-binding transcriptional MerR regulator
MRIGELAAAAGTTTKTLRFYDRSGLLPPTGRSANRYRDYGPEALSRLDFIRRGQAAGLTLAQIREVIDIRDAGVCLSVEDADATRPDEQSDDDEDDAHQHLAPYQRHDTGDDEHDCDEPQNSDHDLLPPCRFDIRSPRTWCTQIMPHLWNMMPGRR